ncbi:hypothetical protein IC229_07165 [Spirosoma sp. BT702]|uniref:YtxH domain-containing protein n=1 Tax=Spirosoma profusum TaxID=2771354 RepID=A0A927ATJ7_9BACT|nr:hypothetical protein [Spirosoma profusum]MBD2700407.1 hypothetical protein [Spirosoma profusum]
MKTNWLLTIALCAALTTGAFAQDNAAVRAERKEKTREDVKRVGDKVETGVADGAHAVGTAGRATGKAVAKGAKATGRAVKKGAKATGRAVSTEAKKVEKKIES